LLCTSVSNGSWERWKYTTRFIVDAYHYTNHQASDRLCRIWCNPAPLDGSAPNLVLVEKDKQGRPYYKHAFNTQARWLSPCGFNQILKRMSLRNFDWFLHTMLFYHSMQILKKQSKKRRGKKEDDEDDDKNL
jgi:hypothetical protein